MEREHNGWPRVPFCSCSSHGRRESQRCVAFVRDARLSSYWLQHVALSVLSCSFFHQTWYFPSFDKTSYQISCSKATPINSIYWKVEKEWYYKYYCFWFTPFLQSILRIPNSYFVRKNNSNQLIVALTIWIAYQGLYIVTKCFNLALCVSLCLFTTFQLKTSRIFLSFSISLLNGIRSISISQNVQCFIKLHRNSWNFSGIAVGLAQSRTIMQISATFVSPNRANYFLRGLKKANRLNRRNSED